MYFLSKYEISNQINLNIIYLNILKKLWNIQPKLLEKLKGICYNPS